MNKYILCYRTEKGNRPCKIPLVDYITGIDVEDVNLNSLWDWEYLIKTYSENNLIICVNCKCKCSTLLKKNKVLFIL